MSNSFPLDVLNDSYEERNDIHNSINGDTISGMLREKVESDQTKSGKTYKLMVIPTLFYKLPALGRKM